VITSLVMGLLKIATFTWGTEVVGSHGHGQTERYPGVFARHGLA